MERGDMIKKLASVQAEVVEEMETRITELKNIIREKEAVIEQLGGGEEQGARVENKATRDSAPDVAKQTRTRLLIP